MKLKPLSQQRTALARSSGHPFFAYFMEQGTGKSFVGLADAESLWLGGAIRLLVVVAPNGVQRQWVEEEAPKHLSVPFVTLRWTPNRTRAWEETARKFDVPDPPSGVKKLKIFAVNVEAFSQKKSPAEAFLIALLKRHPALLIVDESSMIKTPKAQRTRTLIRIGVYAPFKRILTGTPITQSPLDFYAQFAFLRPGLLGFTEWVPFKAFYAEWRERVVPSNRRGAVPGSKVKFLELVRYRNQHLLKSRADAYSYTVTKRDCLDLPDKVYLNRFVEFSPAQRVLYDATLTALIISLSEDERMTLAHAFTRLTRLSQICGGFVKADDSPHTVPLPGPNPKIDSLLQFVEEFPTDRKLIIWARYVPELLAIYTALGRHRSVLYYGGIGDEERAANIERFKLNSQYRFFIGNQKTGKFGFNFAEYCSDMLYYSNDFSAEARWQSEDRIHRIGQSGSCTYTDLTIPGTVDAKILRILRDRKDMADYFKGTTGLLEWLQQ